MPLLAKPQHRDLLLEVLEGVRRRYRFVVVAYVGSLNYDDGDKAGPASFELQNPNGIYFRAQPCRICSIVSCNPCLTSSLEMNNV